MLIGTVAHVKPGRIWICERVDDPNDVVFVLSLGETYLEFSDVMVDAVSVEECMDPSIWMAWEEL